MISSMTGYGQGQASEKKTTAVAEVRTINNRYLEVTSRLPRTLALRENDIKELVRSKFSRGKVNVVVTVTKGNENELPLKINVPAAKAYFKLLTTLKKSVKIQEKVTLDHLLKFPEVLEMDGMDQDDEAEWALAQQALTEALDNVVVMRKREGGELKNDLVMRLNLINTTLDRIEVMAKERLPQERERIVTRLKELMEDQRVIDNNRLEMELALFADRLDLTEECVRFRSHNKFFLQALEHEEGAGRKLNFLVQEMNREANTIGSKANHAEIAHLVVGVKEELEKIREQLQNVE
jgi:uncharacterized protein (TIGR00255 family)